MRECFCFGSEAVNASDEAVRRLVKSRVDYLEWLFVYNQNKYGYM